MAMSFGIPDREHAMGIRSREPPATPDAPHAARVRITGNAKDAAKATKDQACHDFFTRLTLVNVSQIVFITTLLSLFCIACFVPADIISMHSCK